MRTLTIVKPDAVAAGHTGAILAEIESAGFRIVGLRLVRLTRREAEGFYAVHRERPFFASLTRFMSSGPAVVAALEREDAIPALRNLMGATNPQTPPRARCGRASPRTSSATRSTDPTRRRPPPSRSAISSGASRSAERGAEEKQGPESGVASIKSDRWIRRMARDHGLIEPFVDHQVARGVISYGLSAYGYDIRVSDEFKIFTNVYTTIVDPKNFDERGFVDYKGEFCVIPPNSFALSNTIENFRIPRNVYGLCIGKSTYARCGIIINVTGFDAEWRATRPSRYRTRRRCRAASMREKGSPRCSFSRATRSARPATATGRANTRGRSGSRFPRSFPRPPTSRDG